MVMDAFSSRGGAMEIKTIEPSETITAEATITLSTEEAPKPKRGRTRRISVDL
jgi:hypothetical protein